MDFGALLHVAKKNSESTRDADGKYYSTKFAPPKKESKDKKLSHNIQKFLANKEKEERERARIEKEKRDQLLALRDEKSKNKIKKMLKVIKSANKSVLDDAVDNDHTAVSREGGEQPDQDDYGYVSTEANAFYQKYIEKVKDVKEDKVFAPSRPATKTDLNSTKDRVKAAIEREILERSLPHTRVRTAAPKLASALTSGPTSGSLRKKDLYDPEAEREMEEKKKREEEQAKKAKNKKPPPSAMDFQALLKLAEKKQFEPVVVEVEPKKKEPERLLTKKEKKEQEERQKFMEERERRKKEMEKKGGKPSAAIPKVAPERQKMEPNGRIPKLNQSSAPKSSTSSSFVSSNKLAETKSTTFKKPLNPVATSSNSSHKSVPPSKMSTSSASSKSTISSVRPSTNGGTSSSSKEKPIQKPNPVKLTSNSSKPTSGSSSKSVLSQSGGRGAYNGPTREFPPKDTKVRSQQAVQTTRQFPPPDVRRPSKVPERKPQQAVKRRIYDDDDEDEYDSELDDFIDDGPDGEDYSQHIKAIFGYDKSRYRDIDEDDSGMESTFAQQMREEYVSKKIGLMEDLEDMRQEAEDKKRKASIKRKK